MTPLGLELDLDVAVIGAGWAGVATSYCLNEAGFVHRVFERGRVCETWRTQRWSSFHMNTPNVMNALPGEPYVGNEPEGYATCREFIAMLDGYLARHDLPVRIGTEVTGVRRSGEGFLLETSKGPFRAGNIVAATGNLNVPLRPPAHQRLSGRILQIDACDYRDSRQLPDGAVLVVGSGNSGGQIAEDLVRSGRSVVLSTGRNGRLPRRYRGRDTVLWLIDSGRMSQPRPTGTGRALLGATHTISLQSLSAQGVNVVGRLKDILPDDVATFSEDLADCVAFADASAARVRAEIDAHIARWGIDAPPAVEEWAETVQGKFADPPTVTMRLWEDGVRTVIWSVGFTGDFRWLKVPGAISADGKPLEANGISVPGVYFAGLDGNTTYLDGTVFHAERDARRIVDHLARQRSVSQGLG